MFCSFPIKKVPSFQIDFLQNCAHEYRDIISLSFHRYNALTFFRSFLVRKHVDAASNGLDSREAAVAPEEHEQFY